MLCNKAVTPKKIEANRRNAQRSTGPRTDRGKLASKFNAVTLGLFAKHVVILVCDGYGSEKQFGKLLEALREDFQPEGTFEEWYRPKGCTCRPLVPRLPLPACTNCGVIRARLPEMT